MAQELPRKLTKMLAAENISCTAGASSDSQAASSDRHSNDGLHTTHSSSGPDQFSDPMLEGPAASGRPGSRREYSAHGPQGQRYTAAGCLPVRHCGGCNSTRKVGGSMHGYSVARGAAIRRPGLRLPSIRQCWASPRQQPFKVGPAAGLGL